MLRLKVESIVFQSCEKAAFFPQRLEALSQSEAGATLNCHQGPPGRLQAKL